MPGDETGHDGHAPYSQTAGVAWVPLYTPDEVRKRARAWLAVGCWAAVGVAVLALVMVARADSAGAAVVGIAGAVAAGLFLVCAGVGLVGGEALTAVPASDSTRTIVPGGGSMLSPEVLKALKEGISGLTAARSLVFAGAVVIAVAALAGGIAAGQTADAGGASEPSSSSSPSASAT